MKRYVLIPVTIVVLCVVALTSWISLTHEDNTKIPMRTVTDATGTEVVIVRRIGMTKPPVKLGVGKKFL